MNVGFIGMGNMGKPMALNLVTAGHNVIGYDVSNENIDGIKSARSAAEGAKDVQVVITMLPDGEILKKVAEEILPIMTPGSILLDCSTVDVKSTLKVANMASKFDVGSLDAPVSGGILGAEAGTLTFMVGGNETDFNKTQELLDIMGQKSVLCGPAGSGQAVKICNNMILGATMIATCEAFALADKLNLSREKMFEVVSTSSGYSWSMNAYCPAPGVGPTSPSDNNYEPGFSAALMLKDLKLSQQAAKSVGARTPIGKKATELYNDFVQKEGGNIDFSGMLRALEEKG